MTAATLVRRECSRSESVWPAAKRCRLPDPNGTSEEGSPWMQDEV